MKVYFALVIVLCASCATETVMTYPVQSVKETPRGAYIGLISPGAEAESFINGQPVFLNAEGSLFLQGVIHHWYEESHAPAPNSDADAVNALASLVNSAELPSNMDSLYLVMGKIGAGARAAEQTIGGKSVKTYALDAGVEEIIAAIEAEVADRKTVVVYLVLNGEQSAESDFIAGLSEKAVSGASTPRTILSLDTNKTPQRTVQIDRYTTGMNWLIALLVIGTIGIITVVTL
ncbi:MAG: hypothetical protein LBL06_03610 [Treponema sp.]|jgi:hypothetical protein|nr:hypothetical protein [Treponema sp.]